MIIPELPAYLTSLGGAEYKGLIISLFTLTAMLSRPFSGKMADKAGRIPVMTIGTVVCLVCSLMYPLLSSVAAFLVLRLIHGFSTGFTPTGLTAYLADIIPAEKRGEAMGLLGTAGTVGMAAGASIGPPIAKNFSLDTMFYVSSALALLSMVVLVKIKETLQTKDGFSVNVFKIHKRDLFEPRVIHPCIVMVLTTFSYGAVFTVIPDFGDYVKIQNKGLLFMILTISSLAVRLIAGKASDRYGREQVLLVSTILVAIAMVLVGLGKTPTDLMLAMIIYGCAHGMTSPTVFAWATDLSDDRFKGRGISSLYIFMELGIGVGALASGFIYANNPERFLHTFFACSALSGVAFLYLVWIVVKKQRPAIHET